MELEPTNNHQPSSNQQNNYFAPTTSQFSFNQPQQSSAFSFFGSNPFPLSHQPYQQPNNTYSKDFFATNLNISNPQSHVQSTGTTMSFSSNQPFFQPPESHTQMQSDADINNNKINLEDLMDDEDDEYEPSDESMNGDEDDITQGPISELVPEEKLATDFEFDLENYMKVKKFI